MQVFEIWRFELWELTDESLLGIFTTQRNSSNKIDVRIIMGIQIIERHPYEIFFQLTFLI